MNIPEITTAPVNLDAPTPSGSRCNQPAEENRLENTMLDLSDWNRDDCTSWCTGGDHHHDPACWGGELTEHTVLLSVETGFPREAVQPYDPIWLRMDADPPYVGVYAYRAQPGYREVVYLHLYRPSENQHLDLDVSVHLTGQEAVQLANYLLTTAAMVDQALADLDETAGAK